MYMDMLEALRRGDGTVAAVGNDGVLVFVRKSGAYLLAAEQGQAGEALAGAVNRASQLAVHDVSNARFLRDKLGYQDMMECWAAAYIDPAPPSSGSFDPRRVRTLDPGDEQAVLESFPGEFEPAEVRERLRAGALHGVLERGGLQGLVGIYPEGGVGMLTVRQGLESDAAMELLLGLVAYITSWCLENCLAPFAHIPVEDEALRDLYQQVGYTVWEESMYWLG